MDRSDRVIINDIAQRSFRDVADQDYIAARACYKTGLMLQFVWMGEQAIEKYLKAILLFNAVSAKKLGHDLEAAFARVEAIGKIQFDISEQSKAYIKYLNDQGANRYLEKSHYTRSAELARLDRCVWEIRMYCRVLDYDFPRVGNMLNAELRMIREWKKAKAGEQQYGITGAVLEKVLAGKSDLRRPVLVWQNMFYGSRARETVRLPSHTNSINPTHVMHPDKFSLLSKYVDFPKSVQALFKTTP
jgi:HEPN domain-containing protein